MTNVITPDEPTELDKAIARIISAMQNAQPDSQDYAKMATQLSNLTKIREINFNIALKNEDSQAKRNEISEKLRMQNAELDLKIAEAARLKAEAEANLKIREEELRLRDEEVTATTKLRAAETHAKNVETKNRGRVSPETLAIIGANLLGILFVLKHEEFNPITSKALGMVRRLL